MGVFSFARYFPDFYKISGNFFGQDHKRIKLLANFINEKLSHKQMENFDIESILSKENQKVFFRRCVGVLTHEIGHLFGMAHCVYFECVMNGSNHLEESDNGPLQLCPMCLHKLYFCRLLKSGQNNQYQKTDILKRYKNLQQVYAKYGLKDESQWYQTRIEFILKQLKKETSKNVS